MAEAPGAELCAKFKNPLKYQWAGGGAESPTSEIKGYDSALLIDLCKAILQAHQEGIHPREERMSVPRCFDANGFIKLAGTGHLSCSHS